MLLRVQRQKGDAKLIGKPFSVDPLQLHTNRPAVIKIFRRRIENPNFTGVNLPVPNRPVLNIFVQNSHVERAAGYQMPGQIVGTGEVG